MNKKTSLTFHRSDFTQYWFLLQDNEIRNEVSDFLLKYVSIEAFYKRLLISYKERLGKKLTKTEKEHLSVFVTDVRKVLDYYDVAYDRDLIDRIFGSNNSNYMDCSIKKLRDRLVHNVNNNVLRIIVERYESINRDLEEFLNLFI